jgi:hypothetical protein
MASYFNYPTLEEIVVPTVLRMNRLTMPDDFPAALFERVWDKVHPQSASKNALYIECSSAWSALAHRYLAMVEHGEGFTASVIADGTSPQPDRRHYQERCLFDFFSTGFSAFDAFFYAAFAIGAMIDPAAFPLGTEADQRRVSSASTAKAYERRFPTEKIVTALKAFVDSAEYTQWRDIRNVLMHRAAPGRTFHVAPGGADETPVDRWKLFAIPLDKRTLPDRRRHASQLLGPAMAALAEFAETHL